MHPMSHGRVNGVSMGPTLPYLSLNKPISFCFRKTTVAKPTGDDEMVGAEYPLARIASVTLGYALPTRYLLAAGIDEFTINFDGVGARDPVPTHPLMLLRGPDVIRDVA